MSVVFRKIYLAMEFSRRKNQIVNKRTSFLSISLVSIRWDLKLRSLFGGVKEKELIKERTKRYLMCCDDDEDDYDCDGGNKQNDTFHESFWSLMAVI